MSSISHTAGVTATATPDSTLDSTKAGDWVTDRAWISGVVGAVSLVAIAAWYNLSGALGNGIAFAGYRFTDNRLDTTLAAIFIVTGIMLFAECIRLYIRDPKNFFQISPLLKQKKYVTFFVDSLVNYLKYLFLLWLTVLFFHWAGEYGFQRQAPYYRGWFRFLEIVFDTYLWFGLIYVLLTRAIKHDPESDKKDLAALLTKIVLFASSVIPGLEKNRTPFEDVHKKIARGLFVKLFFTPLMTVFFINQFPHLVNNIGYVFGAIPDMIASGQYTHQKFNNDLFNISIALIFSIDVGLAWCGYVISSRWVDNLTFSAEPTVLGWVVCVCCYPPFQMFLGLYFPAPGEREVLRFDSQWIITFFTTMMVLSYLVYMSATLWFGVRFSNLTNRGIIRQGPFAIIRHPAYASKNFAWWCVMFPAIIYNATHTGIHVAITQTLGLCFMTWFYYLRAITEERHLSADPFYVEYCKQVKYRFIPGVI